MSRDHSQNHYGPNASFDGYDSDLASAGILIESLRQQLAVSQEQVMLLRDALTDAVAALEHRWEVIANRAAPIMESVIDAAHTKGVEALAATEPKP